jgi:hypothetical protein
MQLASTDAAFVDFATRVETLLRQEMIESGRNVEHADTAQHVPYVVIFSDNADFAEPAATGSLVAARISKQRPGPKPDDHLILYRIILDTLGYSGQSDAGEPEIKLDDDNLRSIVAAADSKGIKPSGRRPNELRVKPPYSSWAACLTDNKEACRKAIRNRIKWAIARLSVSSRVTG